jgi:hypothetical protein
VITTTADMAPLTTENLDEAGSRLTRLAQVWALHLRTLDAGQRDRRDVDAAAGCVP